MQVRIVLRLNDVMFGLEMSVGGLVLVGACNETYVFAGVYSLVRGEVMQNVGEDAFWSEGSEGSLTRLCGLFRYFLTRLGRP